MMALSTASSGPLHFSPRPRFFSFFSFPNSCLGTAASRNSVSVAAAVTGAKRSFAASPFPNRSLGTRRARTDKSSWSIASAEAVLEQLSAQDLAVLVGDEFPGQHARDDLGVLAVAHADADAADVEDHRPLVVVGRLLLAHEERVLVEHEDDVALAVPVHR